MKIMLVEDDLTIAQGLEYSLRQEGYETVLCHDFSSAKQTIEHELHTFSLFLFDLSLPDGNGYDLCKIVKEKSDLPVIFLTVADEEVNVVMGLELGADDYITKPFRIRELLARIKSVMRRYDLSSAKQRTIIIDDLAIHPIKGKVFKRGEEIPLTALEYQLLLTLANHKGQVLTREQLLDHIWDIAGDFVTDNTLTVYIKRLREKLEDNPSKPVMLKTVRGVGYTLGD
ncbi:MAG TPA: response regulator transcription factor [Bacillota bacterium]|nr:response regulator transcription factor [Bacillota bacterium]